VLDALAGEDLSKLFPEFEDLCPPVLRGWRGDGRQVHRHRVHGRPRDGVVMDEVPLHGSLVLGGRQAESHGALLKGDVAVGVDDPPEVLRLGELRPVRVHVGCAPVADEAVYGGPPRSLWFQPHSVHGLTRP